ncbi:MAG: helix-turn-helix domain-containing protein [Chloroflexota bacterium]|nr:helix-turn-helix domain-containing protein [Chloroflexota bacterium]
MADEQERDMHALDFGDGIGDDTRSGSNVQFGSDDSGDDTGLETHLRHYAHDPAHVDLTKDEYTPDEVARLVGTSKEAVIHAISQGELKADRKGRDIVCIQHHDVVEWLRRRQAAT